MLLAQDFFSDVSLHLVAGTEVSSEVSTGMKDLFPGSLVGVGRSESHATCASSHQRVHPRGKPRF